jgi:hypothetical protein
MAGKTPTSIRTFRVKGMGLCKEVCDGLINHRQWFTFRPIIAATHFNDEYEFDFDSETPDSGYGFTVTDDPDLYAGNSEYGLEVTKAR